jgi:hypothetical protein
MSTASADISQKYSAIGSKNPRAVSPTRIEVLALSLRAIMPSYCHVRSGSSIDGSDGETISEIWPGNLRLSSLLRVTQGMELNPADLVEGLVWETD